MANRCSVWVYKKLEGRWRYCKPEYGCNNKIKPQPGVAYYIRRREGSRIVWQESSSAADAATARDKHEAYLVARTHGLTLGQTDTKPRPALMADTRVIRVANDDEECSRTCGACGDAASAF